MVSCLVLQVLYEGMKNRKYIHKIMFFYVHITYMHVGEITLNVLYIFILTWITGVSHNYMHEQ